MERHNAQKNKPDYLSKPIDGKEFLEKGHPRLVECR